MIVSSRHKTTRGYRMSSETAELLATLKARHGYAHGDILERLLRWVVEFGEPQLIAAILSEPEGPWDEHLVEYAMACLRRRYLSDQEN